MIKIKPFLPLLAAASVSASSSNLRGGNSSYKSGIVSAVAQLKDHGGSSSVSIRDHVQDNLPAGKSFHNSSFTRALKKAVDDGDLIKTTNNSYKLSNGLRRNIKEAAAEKYMTKPEPKAFESDDTTTKKESLLNRLRALAPSASEPKKALKPKKNKAATKKKAAPKKKAAMALVQVQKGEEHKESLLNRLRALEPSAKKKAAIKKNAAPKKKAAPKKRAARKMEEATEEANNDEAEEKMSGDNVV
eukprot:6142_1